MNTLEFAKEVVAVLSDADLSNVIKKAAASGFVVQGFKSPWKAPRAQIIGPGLARKKKGGDFSYITLLKSVVDLKIIIDEEIELFALVDKWLQDDKLHNEIAEQLLQLNQLKNKKCEKEKCVDNFQESKAEINNNNEIKEKIAELQEKNKMLRQSNQSKKIALDNSQQVIKHFQKENEKLKTDVEQLITENIENQNKIKVLQEQIRERDRRMQELISQIGDLEKYKQRAPKILCFCKHKVDNVDFEGYDITFENSWNDEVKDRLLTQNFTEVWFIAKGFNYNVSLEIQDSFCCSVKKYLNSEKMLSEIGGRNGIS